MYKKWPPHPGRGDCKISALFALVSFVEGEARGGEWSTTDVEQGIYCRWSSLLHSTLPVLRQQVDDSSYDVRYVSLGFSGHGSLSPWCCNGFLLRQEKGLNFVKRRLTETTSRLTRRKCSLSGFWSLDGRNHAMVIAESLARVIAAIRIVGVRWSLYLAPKHRIRSS